VENSPKNYSEPENSRVVFSSARIQEGVTKLARRIKDDLKNTAGHEKDLTFIVLLKGGARFAFDLISRYGGKYYYDFVGVASYGDKTCSGGRLEFYHYGLNKELVDRRVIVLLDDICDSGLTFKLVSERIKSDFKPLVVKTCSLIWRVNQNFCPDFYAFKVKGDYYFIGYGLGIGEEYRYLDDILAIDKQGARHVVPM